MRSSYLAYLLLSCLSSFEMKFSITARSNYLYFVLIIHFLLKNFKNT